ncbi:MAG: amidohydrolase family protein [Planctomycetota bacterium]
MIKPFSIILALLLVTSCLHANDQVPGELEDFIIGGATIHLADGETIERGSIEVRGGVIVAIHEGRFEVAVGDGISIITLKDGHHVYPGMIDSATTIGMVEIGAVRATRDVAEAGGGDALNPNAQARLTYNVDSELIPTIRANGVLLTHIHPTGGLVSGQSAVMQLDGWTYEDATVRPAVGMLVNWPSMLPQTAWWVEESAEEQMEERDERIGKLEDFFDRAASYKKALDAATPVADAGEESDPESATGVAASDFDIRYDALVPVLDGTLPVLITAQEASQIEAAVAFAKRRGLRMILVGGAEADVVAELLAENDIPVIITGVHRLPRGRDADVDQPGKLASRLRDAGVTFAISSSGGRGSSWPMLSRNLPYHAAEAVAHGLTRAEAVAAITSSPAEILGIADTHGTLEVGKSATLFVSTGDILDVRSNVTHAWIDGRRVDLSSKHTELRDKYRKRLGDAE